MKPPFVASSLRALWMTTEISPGPQEAPNLVKCRDNGKKQDVCFEGETVDLMYMIPHNAEEKELLDPKGQG